jgi:hypothetical protein
MTTIAQPRSVGLGRTRRLQRRHLWLVPGLGLALLANAQASHLDAWLVPLLVFGIVPHLTVLVGIGQPHERGQLAPRAVPLFNLMHQPLLPALVLGLAAAGVLSQFWLVGALAWLSHIVTDRAMGDGPRGADGYLA